MEAHTYWAWQSRIGAERKKDCVNDWLGRQKGEKIKVIIMIDDDEIESNTDLIKRKSYKFQLKGSDYPPSLVSFIY